jgi:hypothetical protein
MLDPVLHFDQLDLEARQLRLIDVVLDLPRLGLDIPVMDFQRGEAIGRTVRELAMIGSSVMSSLVGSFFFLSFFPFSLVFMGTP